VTNIIKEDKKGIEFEMKFELIPSFELHDFSKIELTKYTADVSDEETMKILEDIRKSAKNWKEDYGVGNFASNRRENSTKREPAAFVVNFHYAHHIGIKQRPHDESKERSKCHTWCQTKERVKTSIICPIGSAWNYVCEPSQHNKDKIHHEASPYNELGAIVAPHFSYAVVHHVRDWEH